MKKIVSWLIISDCCWWFAIGTAQVVFNRSQTRWEQGVSSSVHPNHPKISGMIYVLTHVHYSLLVTSNSTFFKALRISAITVSRSRTSSSWGELRKGMRKLTWGEIDWWNCKFQDLYQVSAYHNDFGNLSQGGKVYLYVHCTVLYMYILL